MIPKVIHYCWFGDNDLPDSARKYIESWKKNCPDYTIVEWNEKNFLIEECCDYVKEAYTAKKWAFVSDYARFWILYNYGGIYFDTDVEMIKPIDDIVEKGAFMGIEAGEKILVAPGLGMAAESGNRIYKEILEHYENEKFYMQDGSINKTTVVNRVSDILYKNGYKASGKEEVVDNIHIYPADYFCPMNYYDGKITITQKTRTIHHYAETWHNIAERKIDAIRRKFYNTRYKDSFLQSFVILPFRIWNKLLILLEKRK